MFLIYSLLIRLYYWGLHIAALFHPKAKLWVNGRRDQLAHLYSLSSKWKEKQIILIHAASYGEYEMAKPIVDGLLTHKDVRIVVSFFSPSGYENTNFSDDRITKVYLPVDLMKHQKAFIEALQPAKVLFIKYEFWFNLLRVLKEKHIPYYYSSLHLNEDSYLFKKYMSTFLSLIKESQTIYCHNHGSQEILTKKGFTNTIILGDTRIQQAQLNKTSSKGQITWDNGYPSIAFGSLIASEFEWLPDLISSFSECNFLIAPHEIDQATIAKLQSLTGPDTMLYSKMPSTTPFATPFRFLIIDTLGDLKYLYKNSTVAYVGAGFEKGPHNIIEPLIYGVPTICGPNIEKFPMAQHLHRENLLSVIEKPKSLKTEIEKLLKLDSNRFNDNMQQELKNLEANIDGLVSDLSLK